MSQLSEVQSAPAESSRLALFPVSFFAVVMGLAGLTIAWRGAVRALGLPEPIWLVLGALASLVMLLVSGLYLLKLLRQGAAVRAEFAHPVRINFFPAISISLLLLSIVWHEWPGLSLSLWGLGTLMQISLTLVVMSSWIHHTHYSLSHANPSWFIPVVGNIIVPIVGSRLGMTELSWFCFSVGVLFWLVLLTIIMYRLFFHEPLPARLTPMLFILLAPPSVGFVSYLGLVGTLDGVARLLYYVALFLALLLAVNIGRFAKVPFFISSWAYSFPLAALTIATFKMAELLPDGIFLGLGLVLLGFLSLLLLVLVIKTLQAIRRREICQSE